MIKKKKLQQQLLDGNSNLHFLAVKRWNTNRKTRQHKIKRRTQDGLMKLLASGRIHLLWCCDAGQVRHCSARSTPQHWLVWTSWCSDLCLTLGLKLDLIRHCSSLCLLSNSAPTVTFFHVDRKMQELHNLYCWPHCCCTSLRQIHLQQIIVSM